MNTKQLWLPELTGFRHSPTGATSTPAVRTSVVAIAASARINGWAVKSYCGGRIAARSFCGRSWSAWPKASSEIQMC